MFLDGVLVYILFYLNRFRKKITQHINCGVSSIVRSYDGKKKRRGK